LLLRNFDSRSEGLLGWRKIIAVALEENFAFATKEQRVCPAFRRLLGTRQARHDLTGGIGVRTRRALGDVGPLAVAC
jgi:hypothetical protein